MPPRSSPDVVASLRASLPGRSRRFLQSVERAAVLVPIVDDGDPLRLLMTRRSVDLPTHQGHVAFPGGFMMTGEADPIATALREASEEIALPRGAVEVLGLLDDFATHTGTVAVTPVVGRIVSLPGLVPAPAEVARIFTIPLHDLLEPTRWSAKQEMREDGARTVYSFEHDGETLWGLSARIVLHLLDLTSIGSPVPI